MWCPRLESSHLIKQFSVLTRTVSKQTGHQLCRTGCATDAYMRSCSDSQVTRAVKQRRSGAAELRNTGRAEIILRGCLEVAGDRENGLAICKNVERLSKFRRLALAIGNNFWIIDVLCEIPEAMRKQHFIREFRLTPWSDRLILWLCS